MARTNEIKSIMRQLRNSEKTKNESIRRCFEEDENETTTENDVSESDVLMARLEDIISRFEKALSIVDEEEPTEDEEPAEEELAEDEEPMEDEEPVEEEPAEESFRRMVARNRRIKAEQASLERRIAMLERKLVESRRRKSVRKFTR